MSLGISQAGCCHHCQDNLQPGTGAVGTGEASNTSGCSRCCLRAIWSYSPAFTRLSLLRAVQLLFLCVVLGLQEEENVEKSVVQVLLGLWASPLVGCMD